MRMHPHLAVLLGVLWLLMFGAVLQLLNVAFLGNSFWYWLLGVPVFGGGVLIMSMGRRASQDGKPSPND